MMSEVDELGVGKRNPHRPSLLQRIVAEALFIKGVVEPHHQVSESELAGSLAYGSPALVHGLRSGERVFQDVEVHLRLEDLAEVAWVKQAAEAPDFGISQAMNAQPDECAENDNDRLSNVRIHDRQ